MKTITISRRTIERAIERAHAIDSDWTAEVCELLLVPALAKRWQELNPRMLPRLERVAGKPHIGYTRDMNVAIGNAGEWSQFAGYLFTHAYGQWNSVRGDGFMHSASCAYDGIRRETVFRFVDDLRSIAHGNRCNGDNLATAKIVVK